MDVKDDTYMNDHLSLKRRPEDSSGRLHRRDENVTINDLAELQWARSRQRRGQAGGCIFNEVVLLCGASYNILVRRS